MAENTIALVFTDLVNSTAIKNNLPGNSIRDRNETYRDAILLPHRQRVTESLAQYVGRVVEEPPGDGFFLVFPNATQAVQWAVIGAMIKHCLRVGLEEALLVDIQLTGSLA
ncbi:MAG: hypothetical protein HC856_09640 [Pseudanabaena sp. RU_4_16]|nr:hypothetical protein [Pseudanabaena sp. SU_2_4]NJM28392.1 hypothetical protein [Pseudanabaena sp. RU_4_16]